MRGERSNKSKEKDTKRDSSREEHNRSRDRRSDNNAFGWSKKKVPTSRSGRVIKGRGVFVCKTIFCYK